MSPLEGRRRENSFIQIHPVCDFPWANIGPVEKLTFLFFQVVSSKPFGGCLGCHISCPTEWVVLHSSLGMAEEAVTLPMSGQVLSGRPDNLLAPGGDIQSGKLAG